LPFTAAPETPTLTPTPSLTPTLTEPDPEFHPTDPKTVKLESGKVQLIEFFAYWCGSCRALAPTLHRLEDRYGRRMNFIYLDTDNPKTQELKHQLGFRSEPQIFLLDQKGKVLRIWGSGVTATALEDAIRSALQ
jgi:thioredoxin 1